MINNLLLIWDWSSNTVVYQLTWYYSALSNIKYLNNNLLAAPASSSSISVWDVTSGKVKYNITGGVLDLQLMTSSYLATSGADNLLKVWNIANGQLKSQISVASAINVLKQVNQTILAGGGSNGNIYMWSLTSSLQMILSWNAFSGASINGLDLSSNGLLISMTASTGVLKVWNITTSAVKLVGQLTAPSAISCFVNILSSSLVALGSAVSSYIQFVNVTNNCSLSLANQVPLLNPSAFVTDMSLTSESYLVVCQNDGTVLFLNVNTSTFLLGLTPLSSSIVPGFIELIGKLAVISLF
jgi:WD40 repeat protein